MKIACTLILALLGLIPSTISAEPVLARVVEVVGSVQGAGAIKPGATLPATAALTVGPASRVTFHGFPGSVVSFGVDTQAAINRISIDHDKGGGSAMVRAASFKLDEGILFFSIDKVNWDTTTFEVNIPTGRVSAKRPVAPKTASVGVVEVRKGKLHVSALAGAAVFTAANGKSIAIDSGSVLIGTGGGFELVNLISGQIATYDGSASPTGTRQATNAELTAASQIFSTSAGFSESLVVSGAVSGTISSAITDSLIAVNQKLAELGLEPVNTTAVGSLPGNGTSAALPALGGAPGAGGANPANTAGGVRSPER